MYLVVMALGLAAAAAGLVAVAFGLSIKEFSLGNTLLIAGTTAFVGGLVMIAVAGAIRELRRIAEALASRPAPRLLRPGEPLDPYAPGAFRPPVGAGRMPPPPMPVPVVPEVSDIAPPPAPQPETASAEPVPDASEPAPRTPQPQPHAAGEPPTMVDAPETVPLSPGEPRPQSFDRAEELPQPEPDTHQAAAYDAGHDADTTSAPISPKPERARLSPFDAIWPARGQSSADRDADEAAPSRDDANGSKSPAAVDAPPEPPHAVSILKSGVVDGMAYTLYSDGSIEAELPSGTLRFASIVELREHLEKTE
jgi:hypothetical protein